MAQNPNLPVMFMTVVLSLTIIIIINHAAEKRKHKQYISWNRCGWN